jgi:anaphase-promoting complex subunit 6
MIKMEKWNDALELLGDTEICQSQKALDVKLNNTQGRALKIESKFHYLRGLAMLNVGSKANSKQSFLKALQTDSRCYDALEELVNNSMLAVGEDKQLIDNIQESGGPTFELDFIKSVYSSKLRKFINKQKMDSVHKVLTETYHYMNSPLIAIGKAEFLMVHFDFHQAYHVLERFR